MTANVALSRRAQETWLVRRYTMLATDLAASGRYGDAYACQSMADTHRVMAALWSKASSANDPVGAFFDLASQVMRSVLGGTARQAAPPSASLAAMRAAWGAALESYNLPLPFSTVTWIERCEHIDSGAWREAILGSHTWQDYVDVMLQHSAGKPLRERQAAAVMSYLVQVAGAAGDESMMSAAARWLLISAESDPTNGGTLLDAAQKVLGPVEWVRMAPIRDLLSL